MNKISSTFFTAICFLLLFSAFLNHVSAQTETKDKRWSFLAEPYLMFPYMNGETGIGESLVLPVDATAGDIFSKLQMGAMLNLEARTNKWAITSDLVYMNLNQEVTPGILLHSGSVTAKQLIWEATGLYRVLPFLEVGAGGRLNNLQTSTDVLINKILNSTEEVTGSGNKTWYDPIIITRLTTDIKDKWLFQFRGDVGGFGLGSDLTWQLQGYAGYRLSKLFQLTAGYRVLSTDYKSGEAPNEFVFKVKEFGPVIKFGFNF